MTGGDVRVDGPRGAAPLETISPREAAFERWRRIAGAALAPLAFVVAYWLCAGHLTPAGQTLAAILVTVLVLWVCETLPLPVTAVTGAVLSIVLGVAPARQVLAYFADPIVFLFIGSFMLARAMTLHRLDQRIALSFLSIRWISTRPARLLAGLGFVTAGLSMWVSNTATTAMMLPIALGILGALHHMRVRAGLASGAIDARHWPFATGMLLMVAYGASIGGIGTPVGSPPNLITIGFLEKADPPVRISFFTWMQVMVPMVGLMYVVLFALLYVLHRDRRVRGADGRAETAGLLTYLREERDRLGPWSRGQVNTLIAFLVAVTLWVIPGIIQAASADPKSS